MSARRAAIMALWLISCTAEGGSAEREGGADAAPDLPSEERPDAAPDLDTSARDGRLPARRSADPARAARGQQALLAADGPLLPWEALRALWVVWGRFGSPAEADYWAEFCERYGFTPRGAGQPPWGIERRGSQGTVQCMACHVNQIAGLSVIGAGNSALRLDLLLADLLALRERAAMFGVAVPELPAQWRQTFEGRTGGPGAVDAFGMGMTLAAAYAPGTSVAQRYGFQQAPEWWRARYKDRSYTDGSAAAGSHRLMFATSLASGEPLAALQARDEAFADIEQYLLSLEPPAAPYERPDAALVARGRAVFDVSCASCHGVYDSAAGGYPDHIEEVGTDALRHERFGAAEVALVNASWFGQPPMQDSQGYLAPPLVGVWASAPYLHNGSVPDLRALLRSAERPTRWRLDPGGGYDAERVGPRWIEAATGDDAGYDTTREGLSSAGHTFADALGEEDVTALLGYLKTL